MKVAYYTVACQDLKKQQQYDKIWYDLTWTDLDQTIISLSLFICLHNF